MANRLNITKVKRPDGKYDLQIDMSADVEAHLQHDIEKPVPDCVHCQEQERLFKSLGLDEE
jgi:hypothetical protein